MSLNIEFKVEKTTLLCQENPVCHLTATNTGNSTMKVASPGASPEIPILHITELKTGVETFQHGHRHGPDVGLPYQELAADKKIEYDFDLNSVAHLSLPTEYEVSAILYYDSGAKRPFARQCSRRLGRHALRRLGQCRVRPAPDCPLPL
jgi:hypothetical protein